MTGDFQLEMNEYLPLRDVVFQTLQAGDFKRRTKTGRATDGDPAGTETGVSRTPVREATARLELEVWC